jgi:DNA mismatch repair protein MutS
VGDFYETFFEDAKVISKELELTLTSRSESTYNGGKIPMAGIPAKALNNYVSKLLEKGFRVAICEQMEDPALAKGIVKREITKLLTPGTILETEWLPHGKNNYIAAIYKNKKNNDYGFAYVDISCGEFYIAELNYDELISELNRIMPSEVIVSCRIDKTGDMHVKDRLLDVDSVIKSNWFCTGVSAEYFTRAFAEKRLKEELKLSSLDSIGGDEFLDGIIAAGAIFSYIDSTNVKEKPAFEKILPYEISSYVLIDKTTRKNLELTESVKGRVLEGSLFWAVDYTNTQMGKRRLRNWIEQPLLDIVKINDRLSCIDEFIKHKEIIHELGSVLENISDIERISSKLSASSVNAKELIALRDSLSVLPNVVILLKSFILPFFKNFSGYLSDVSSVCEIITNAILENPSNILMEGNLIKSSYSNDLKKLREIIDNGDSWLKSYELNERTRSGIKNLKISFNRAFGYFIEISKGNLGLVPSDYTCRQTMVNSSRFITPELKEYEQKALHAEQKIKNLEYEIFSNVRGEVKKYVNVIRQLAYDLSILDAFYSLANVAIINNYRKPILDKSGIIELKSSRHPVLERKIGFVNFVPNDCFIESSLKTDNSQQLIILTGPNMAGKSTYMRQVALNVILAQIGSYVPCDYARIGVVDQIFTRVGATDDISEGKSTFMVEMNETSLILNKMTKDSLILLDEVGRGTSTYDGVAIAWALAEYLVKNNKPRTVFATHFHELNGLAELYPSISNYQVAVKEEPGNVIFLRKVIPGGADKSYGIEVAKMAGLPKELLSRAEAIMSTMYDKSKPSTKKQTIKSQIESGQLSLFD